MKRHDTWFGRQTRQRPFLSALVILIIVVVPGYARIESTASDAHNAAVAAKATTDRQAAAQKREDLSSCQTRNTFQRNTRIKFEKFLDGVEIAFVAGNPNQDPARLAATHKFIDQLRGAVETKPEQEDRDCNSDGKYDETDYLP